MYSNLIKQLPYLILILFFSMNIIYGEDASLGTIVVTAESGESKHQTGDVVKEDLSTFYKEIKRKEFEGRYEDISGVIEKEAGIQILQRSGFGSYSTASIRGSSSKQVLVYIDGMLLNDANGGIVDLSTISLSDVESIEVFKGFTPIQFGKAYSGGAINIKTKRSKKGLRAHVLAGRGSYETQNIALFMNYKPNLFDFLINIDYQESKNDYPYFNDQDTPLNPLDDKWEKRNNNYFQQFCLLTKFAFDLHKKLRLDLMNQAFYKDKGFPTIKNSSIAKSYLITWRNLMSVKLTGTNLGKGHINTYGKFDFIYIDEHYNNKEGDIGIGPQNMEYNNYSYAYNHFFEWPTKNNILISTLGIKKEIYDQYDITNSDNFPSSSRETYSIGVEDTIILFKERFLIKPLFRYLYILDKLKTGVDSHGTPVPAKNISRHSYNPQIGLKYSILKWLSLKTNFSRNEREPTFFELFGNHGTFIGQVDLKAEIGYNFDAGFEIRYKSKKKLFKLLDFNFSYFRSDVEDVIVHIYDTRGVGRADNISKAEIQGVELNLGISCLKFLRLNVNYTWNDATNLSKISQTNKKKLPGTFEHSFFLKTEFIYKWIKIFYEFSYGSEMYYDTPNILKAQNQLNHTLGLSLHYSGLLFAFEIKNLGNNLYEDYYRLRTPGTAYYFSIKYGFTKNEKKKK